MKLNRAVSVLLVFAVLSACGRKGNEEAANAAPPEIVLGPADVAVVARGEVSTGPALSGTLTAQDQATVRAEVSGSVTGALVEPGEQVRRGQTLARLEADALGDALTSALAAVTTARSALALAQREEERQRALVQVGAVAERNVETARQQTAAARSALAQAQAQLASAQAQLGETRVTSPLDGVVSEKTVSAGDVVQPGTALYTIVDPSSLELEASIPAERLSTIHPGAPVEFRVNGFPGRTFRGRITRINPSADPATRQVRVYAEIPNEGDLVAGLFAEGRVESQSQLGLILPEEAIDRRMGRPAVLKVQDGKVLRVEVELGLADEQSQQVEVRRGVQEKDIVLRGAAQEIAPGTAVRLAPALQQQVERLAQR
ncbi:MAG TPA: efflux RND transporter periplasmic adaptor subunit [Thermoanaerobaculia bacterium]|nr:efflux RND transporter periplasmic adaptor subunit [Thermoanaerobaculia bacterium]